MVTSDRTKMHRSEIETHVLCGSDEELDHIAEQRAVQTFQLETAAGQTLLSTSNSSCRIAITAITGFPTSTEKNIL